MSHAWKVDQPLFKKRCVFGMKLGAFIMCIGFLTTAYSDSSGSPKAPGMPEAYAFELSKAIL